MQRGERLGLATQIAAMERFIVHADEKLTAFLELESAIHAAAIVLDEQVRFFQSSASAKRI
jgi:hypothetical protein